MNCARCGHGNLSYACFCAQCGERLPRRLPPPPPPRIVPFSDDQLFSRPVLSQPDDVPLRFLGVAAPLVALIPFAVMGLDGPLIERFTLGGVWHDATFRVLLPSLALIVLATLVTVILHAPNWRQRGIGLATLVGAVLMGGLLDAWRRQVNPTGPAGTAFDLAAGALAWGTLIVIMTRLVNFGRLLRGLGLALLLSTVATHVVKWTAGRARPDTHLGVWHLQPGDAHSAFASFPSGHSTAAATVAGVLTVICPRGTPIFVLYALAIGFERVVANKHFPSDVLAGWAFGLIAAGLARKWLGPSCFTRRVPEDAAAEDSDAPDGVEPPKDVSSDGETSIDHSGAPPTFGPAE
jgi:membrane-associated phospholipid phosphatase